MAFWGLPRLALADCDADIQNLEHARNAELEKIHGLANATPNKPLDPKAFCVVTAGVGPAEQALIDYMVENKERCSFLDRAINDLEATHAKNASFRAKACSVVINSVPADEKPFPFKVHSAQMVAERGVHLSQVLQLTISPDDDRIVTSIVVNRGNCPLFYGPLDVADSERFIPVRFPIHFKFGINKEFLTNENCDLREMILYTDDNKKWIINCAPAN